MTRQVLISRGPLTVRFAGSWVVTVLVRRCGWSGSGEIGGKGRTSVAREDERRVGEGDGPSFFNFR